MNEWQTIAWFVGISSAFLGTSYGMVSACKKDLENTVKVLTKNNADRIFKCEHVIDDVVRECHNKRDDFITVKAFDRFEFHLNTKFDGMSTSINHLTTRIDDFIKSNRNGKKHD